ncbi:lasso peptide biosynthesis B2 protein [Metabacillus litoralis]|uniref:lasso peptide biosynthesis B2 protein n=1 Tax=Metabacillus litoralis TaxID=152268 RepID=UPI001CFE3D29|nr:lasso peptide biosynthesis B2 protein [Metabacillus litoralis]
MRSIVKFIKLPFKTKLLLVEAYIFLGFSRFLIVTTPFKRISKLLGSEYQETAVSNDGINLKQVRQVSRAIQIMSKYTFWESKCLAQSYTATFMLSRRKLQTTTYLGVAKDETGNLIAHAWTRCGTVYVTGGNGGKFTVTGRFATRDALRG